LKYNGSEQQLQWRPLFAAPVAAIIEFKDLQP
jgi:hypothetical protein